MFHLDPGVHLDKIELAIPVQDKFDGAGTGIPDRLRGLYRGLRHRGSLALGKAPRRRLLNHLLVAPLQRAVALTELDHVALGVPEDLEFDVPRGGDQLFQIEGIITERRGRLRPCFLKGALDLIRGKGSPHPAAASARGGLDEHRITDPRRNLRCLRRVPDQAVGSRNHRNPAALHQRPGTLLVPHLADHLRGWPDERNPGIPAHLGEIRIFRE